MSTARMTPDGLPAGFLAQSESFSTIRFGLRADKKRSPNFKSK
jgi:hypothetical protein